MNTEIRTGNPEKTTPPCQFTNLKDPALYINRELSWLDFNWRVLEEALDERHPLLERVKFLSIFSSNLDEFFMIRVSGLLRQMEAGAVHLPPDGLETGEQLRIINERLLPYLDIQSKCWWEDLAPKLRTEGIRVLQYSELQNYQRKILRQYFEREIFPTLTPLAIDPGHPFPHISNLSLNLAIVIYDPISGERFARLKVPDMFPRLLPVPNEEMAGETQNRSSDTKNTNLVWVEEVVAANLDLLFPGFDIIAVYPFRVTRDADLEIEEDEASDLLISIQERIGLRRFGSVVRLEVNTLMPKMVREMLSDNLKLNSSQIYTVTDPIGMADLMELMRIERSDLKDPPFLPAILQPLAGNENIFTHLRRRDFLLYHPYDSFSPVVDFLRQAARDPNVLAIKQTLYRVGTNSPIVDALMEARDHNKQVAVLVELKARFDEENNIGWAQALERAGVHVVYGVLGVKTHAKVCMVVRREQDGITRYVHMGTGNYNVITSRVYTDLSFFTCDPEIGADVSDLFNALTGYSRKEQYRKLLVAPLMLRREIIGRIEREIEQHHATGDGYLAFKMNALVDQECIQALYRASQAGVKVDLQIRGICCLRPGIPGISENITVTSIVGRFLEHSRIYYFHNGGKEELILGSADLMPRNLDRRIEVLFPVEDPHLKKYVHDQILQTHLKDNIQVRKLMSDGRYERIVPKPGEPVLNSQLWMLEHRGRQWTNETKNGETIASLAAATQEP